jgi:hypothetical protein
MSVTRHAYGLIVVGLFALSACNSHSEQSIIAAQQAGKDARQSEARDRDAGFAYAKKLGVVDPEVCNSGTPGFVEGCETWVSLQLQSTGRDNDDNST